MNWPVDYLGKILNMDCLEAMRGMPDKSIDLILTDPPYGLNEKMKGGTWGINSIYKEMLDWDKLVGKEYFDEIFRVSKNQIVWGGALYNLPISRCWLAWIKKERMDTLGDFELAWTSFDKLCKAFDERRNPQFGKRMHPTQKPVSLFAWCIKNYSNENDLIFDPFVGSGTTAVAAQALGRRFIGVDISPKYCEISRLRLLQKPLF